MANGVIKIDRTLTIQQANIVPGNYGGSGWVKKTGRIVEIFMINFCNSDHVPQLHADIVVGVIPEGFRPLNDTHILGSIANGVLKYDYMRFYSVKPDGNIYTYTYSEFEDDGGRLHGVYMI